MWGEYRVLAGAGMHYGEWSSLKIFLLPLNLGELPLLLLEYGAEIVSYYCSSRLSHSLLSTKFQMLLINMGMEKVEEYMRGGWVTQWPDSCLPLSTWTIIPYPLLFSTKAHSSGMALVWLLCLPHHLPLT